ncbi:phosphatidylinositol 3-kinase C2 domain-containing subunit gamma isoform X1 [Periophthalmus magnuspinnatus]|uniref:phosphatidylinositol 3-kinase C2 domain-containing subunit gamma isoform X1 n=1 Tax=Periophthalmus magnuspinnatus TaxID=409849 RepID=UPI00145B29D4|nr:phosphatidylinositol 3-kinase C2 domain-containing subunit gamma isoform X1 [Periophthalmus magnuspinnatus]
MDSARRRFEWLNRQDAEVSDEPLPLRDDIEEHYEPIGVFPENEEHIYEPTIEGIISPTNQRPIPRPRSWIARTPQTQQVTKGLQRTRFSEYLPGRLGIPPPPLPPRGPLLHTRSAETHEPISRFPRSRTEFKVQDPWGITLVDTPQGSTKSLATLSSSVSQLMSRYKHTDEHNTGIVWARLLHIHPALLQQVEVTVSVATDWDNHQLPFPTPVNQTVNSVIDEVFTLLDIPRRTNGRYVLKLCDSEEYLHNEDLLGMHETIHTYCRFNYIVPMRLLHINDFRHCLARDVEDDRTPCELLQFLHLGCFFNVSKLSLQDVLGNFNKEVANFMKGKAQLNVHAIVGRVRTVSSLLCGVSTQELEDAIGMINRINPVPMSAEEMSQCETAILMLHKALQRVLQVFFDNFQSDFRGLGVEYNLQCCDIEQTNDILQFNVAALYRLQSAWMNYECFSVSCDLLYVNTKICESSVSENISTALAYGTKIQFNRPMVFPVQLKNLPYESMLKFRLMGSKRGKSPELLCWAVLPLFNNRSLVNGTILLSMSSLTEHPAPPSPALADAHRQPMGVLIQLEFSHEFEWTFWRPLALPGSSIFSQPCQDVHKKMREVSMNHCLCFLTPNEKAFLWSKRYVADKGSTFLHLLLGGVEEWRPENLTEIYTVVDNWAIHLPEEALFLLSDNFHDQTVRKAAVRYFEQIPDSELENFLPQLVQALRSEWELDGPLVMLLLERSVKNIRIAHQLYWLLEDAHQDPHYQNWFSKVQAALRHCCGHTLRKELDNEARLVSLLTQVADKVRQADKSKRKGILNSEKYKIKEFFHNGTSCCLPLDPAVHIAAVDIEACKFYNSNAAPLGLSFIGSDLLGKNVSIICKTGDNLRQDMLVLQIVRMMDQIWLQEGLDMQMVTYKCLSTGRTEGLIEVVPEAVTLGKIHQEWGLSGTMRDDTLEKWFHMFNKTHEDYEKAVTNFIHSCAGWCVATFILGICDRHNDNIMLKNTGHMFHIDFGKIFGNAQKFGSFKRDRSPFIFSSEMCHFITCGRKKPQRMHLFVDLCCQAYNAIRGRSALILSLLELMLYAGMPEVKSSSVLQFVQNNLRPQDTDLEATSFFTMKIEESLKCVFVKINFMTHTFAQGKKTGIVNSEGGMPSTSTNIQHAVIQGYSGEGKQVNFDLRITIDDGYTLRKMTFGQFELIHKRIQNLFIDSALPQFPSWFQMSFTSARKMSLLNKYLKQLFDGPCKGNEYVCTLFMDGPEEAQRTLGREARPQIQLNLTYKDNKLSVLIKHLKNIKYSSGSSPDTYVVTRLRPDPRLRSKRKTKMVRNNGNPTFNELIEYDNVPANSVYGMVLEATVKSRKKFVGATSIKLEEHLFNKEQWFPLGNCEV